MFEKILVPFDFSKVSQYTLQCSRKIPDIREIVLLNIVYTKYPSKDPVPINSMVDYARLRLNEVKSGLEMPGLNVKTIVKSITGGEIYEQINRIAEQENISLTVMGRRGRGIIETLLLGSVASDILHHGTTNLLLVHPPEGAGAPYPVHDLPCPDFFSNVLICLDFSEPDLGSICMQEMPWIRHATLFHVVTTGDSHEEIKTASEAAQVELERMRVRFVEIQIPADVHVRIGSAAEEIMAYAEREGTSLIILKSTGKKGLLTKFIGSTTAYVARNAQRPVLVVRRPVHDID